jgi:caffeic acid 3-O-methyltransferase
MKQWITHNWDDEHLLKLLKNCYEALPDNGKVIVVDMVVPETPETNVKAKSMLQNYLFMTSMSPQGKERTEKEFETLGKEAGFSHIRVACFVCNFSVVEFIKKLVNNYCCSYISLPNCPCGCISEADDPFS